MRKFNFHSAIPAVIYFGILIVFILMFYGCGPSAREKEEESRRRDELRMDSILKVEAQKEQLKKDSLTKMQLKKERR